MLEGRRVDYMLERGITSREDEVKGTDGGILLM